MDIIILTGMSGAGKSQAAAFFEDQDYFCIDNLQLEDRGYPYRIIFLEASDNVLVSRYRQTRRKHPLTEEMSLVDAIAEERNMLKEIRGRATAIIDTTMMPLSALRKELRVVLNEAETQGLTVFVQSFGFMYGIPTDADNVFDVRFLPNPFWVEKLQMLSGKDIPIVEYLMGFEETRMFLDKINDMLNFMVPYYIREGKSRLNIGVGCTGGRHRSVFIAETIGQILEEAGYRTIVHHRDIDRDPRYEKKSKTAQEVLMKCKDELSKSREKISLDLKSGARYFLRGAFLVCGYVTDPKSAYRIELRPVNPEAAEVITGILTGFDISYTEAQRGDVHAIYIRNGDSVSDFLGIIGASTARLTFENIRIEREVYSDINRAVNCDSGNTGRQAEAAVRRGELIGKLMASPEAEKLPKSLYEAAIVHQQNPGASIAELGSLMNPPISKSGMNHRLSRLIEIAESM